MNLLELRDVRMYFVSGGLGRKRLVRAVDGVSLKLEKGEVLGLVGESGSGKSTLGRVALRLYKPTGGRVLFKGTDITDIPEQKLRPLRRLMQLVPQDPYASFNPVQTIGEAITEPLLIHGVASTSEEARDRVYGILERVGLTPPEEFYNRKPYHLSGGQLQRAAIARAMILEPEFVVADEPTSSLDVSIRASILDLLQDFKERLGQGMIFITHDLATARLVSDRIAVMYLGRVVEEGPTRDLIEKPLHPYTAALLSAVPKISKEKPAGLRRIELSGEIPDPANPPGGCPLHPRCPLATGECRRRRPELTDLGGGRRVACHYPLL